MDDVRSKLRKVQALKNSTTNEGERQAAAAAMERLAANEARVSILSTIMDIDRVECLFVVEYLNIEGAKQTCHVERELFQQPAKVVEKLLKIGAVLPLEPKRAQEAVRHARDTVPRKVLRVTSRPGWHDGTSIVLPGQTYGEQAGKLEYRDPNDGDSGFGFRAGTLADWQGGLSEPFGKSDYLILAVGAKAANLMLEPLGETEAFVLHFHGTTSRGTKKTASSSGKTLATRVAASASGRAGKNDLLTFAISETALHDHCHRHTHIGVEIDEEGRSLGGGRLAMTTDQLAYQLTSGRGTVRSHYATRRSDLKNRTWLTGAMSSGEPPLDGRQLSRAEGAQVRMIALPVPPGDEGGIFNRVKLTGRRRLKECARLAQQTEDTIGANFGVLFPALAEQLVRLRTTIGPQLAPVIDSLMAEVTANGGPWERRLARKLAIAGAAAIFLSRLQLCPWSEKRAKRAFRRLYWKARTALRSDEELATRLVARIRKRLRAKQFPRLEKGDSLRRRDRTRAKRIGFRRTLPGHGEAVLLSTASVGRLLKDRAAVAAVLKQLSDRDLIYVGDDAKSTRQVAVNGLGKTRRRFVCFKTHRILEGK